MSASISATVDSTIAHRGKQSVKIVGAANYSNHIFVRSAVPAMLGAVVYGRFYVRIQDALGTNHTTFMAMKETQVENPQPGDLRMGGQGANNQPGVLAWNREKGDPTLPSMSPQGASMSVPLPTGETWTCIEFRIDGDKGTMQTWVNGSAVPGLQEDGVKTPDVDESWIGSVDRDSPWRPRLGDLRLGWENYSNQANTLWFDDVALGESRIGCY
jgi:hypothetical protein